MTIGTDSLVKFFEGDTAGLATTSALIAAGGFSIATDLATWTNTDDAPYFSGVLKIDPASAPAADGYVYLYAQLLNIQGTNDQPIPTANFRHTAIGRFPVKDDATVQYIHGVFYIPGHKTGQEYQFFIENGLDVQIDAAWDLYPDSQTVGPHA